MDIKQLNTKCKVEIFKNLRKNTFLSFIIIKIKIIKKI